MYPILVRNGVSPYHICIISDTRTIFVHHRYSLLFLTCAFFFSYANIYTTHFSEEKTFISSFWLVLFHLVDLHSNFFPLASQNFSCFVFFFLACFNLNAFLSLFLVSLSFSLVYQLLCPLSNGFSTIMNFNKHMITMQHPSAHI